MKPDLKIIPTSLLNLYLNEVDKELTSRFDMLTDAEISTPTFSFYTSVSSVFSSKIEGEEIDLDSYVKHKRSGISYRPDHTRKIDDLYNAYLFAQENNLNAINIAKAHSILTENILAKEQRGKIRQQNMYVTTPDGKIEYVAVSPMNVETEMKKLFDDIKSLKTTDLNVQEVFFYASMIHLVFVKIHPFSDGNGRMARLIEKWFLAQHLGEKAWLMRSEELYYHEHQTYYNNLRALGLEYDTLDLDQALPFLLMLPSCLTKTYNP